MEEHTSFTPPTIEALNQLLPAYHFIDFIAKGGMGAVYLAKQISLDREVAIKILPRELSEDPEFRASFQTEARAMARLNHPNLIGIYDSGDVDGMLYIAMEYVPGKSLYHSAWNKKIDQSEAARIVMAICDGLSHAHEAGIIHRDIKPANILLTPKVDPKIGDFGLAQAIGAKHDGIVMGTPGYAAPEVLSHPEKADRRSDLFALGVILHELLTGQKPEAGVLASSISQCSPEFDLIIQRATHANPVMRYPDAASMALAIKTALKGGSAVKTQSAAAPLKVTRAAAPMQRAAAIVVPAGPTPARAVKQVSEAAPAAAEEDDDDDDGIPLAPLKVSSGGSSWSFVRNMLIIAAMLVVCVFVYQKLQIYKEDVARREKDYDLKQKEEAMRSRREAEAEQKKAIAAAANPDPVVKEPAIKAPTNDQKQEPETAMESLERLQFALSQGERTEMPIGTKRRGDMDFFLVTEPMTWDAALAFSETYGGHVALPLSEDEISLLNSMLKNNETVWLGAGLGGREQWLLLDGSPWPLPKVPGGIGNFATLSHLGNLKAAEGNRKLPFIIAWHRDGSNTASLAVLLQHTRKSLESQTPSYPPGTLVLGSRHFLPIMRDVSRTEAQRLAEQAGAHIAALATKEEGYWVDDTFAKIVAPQGIFLGGAKVNGVWQWDTKEAWTYANWAKGFPLDDEDAVSLVYVPGKGWQNLSKEEKSSGVLLEWSQDAQSTAAPSENLNATGGNIATLITKAREVVQATAKEHNEKIIANTRSFTWDLDVWARGLKPLEKQMWQQQVVIAKSMVKDDRVPTSENIARSVGRKNTSEDASGIAPGIIKIHTYSFMKQKEIDANYELRIGKIRDSYVGKLKELGTAAQKAGQQDMVRQLKNYLDEAEDWQAWADSLLEE